MIVAMMDPTIDLKGLYLEIATSVVHGGYPYISTYIHIYPYTSQEELSEKL